MATQNFPLSTADTDKFTNDRQEMDDAIQSLNETSIGTSAPSNTPEGKKWADSNPTRAIFKFRTNSAWYRLSFSDGWAPVSWTVNNVSDASTLAISGDRTSTLEPNGQPGRMLKVVQPTNGTVISPIASTSYDSNNDETTVNLDPRRTQDLDSTEGADQVQYGEDRPDEDGTKALVPYEKMLDDAFYTVQSAELDLSGTNQVDLIPSGSIPASAGGDQVMCWAVYAAVTTQIAADTTTPVVEIRDNSGNNLGLTINSFTDGDTASPATIRKDDNDTDGTTITKHDSTAEKIQAVVTTAAADSSTAQGKVKLLFVAWPLN